VIIHEGSLFELAKSAVYGLGSCQLGIMNKLLKACPKLKFGGFDNNKTFDDPNIILMGEKSSDLYMWSHFSMVDYRPYRFLEPKPGNRDIDKKFESHSVGPGLSMGSRGWQLRHALWEYLKKTGFEFACFVEEK
jgi:hypothetical protein